MSTEMKRNNIHIDHAKPIFSIKVSEGERLKEVFKRKDTQPLLEKNNPRKERKFNLLVHQLHFIKSY